MDEKAVAWAADPGRTVVGIGDKVTIETTIVSVIALTLNDREVGRRATELVAADVGCLCSAETGDGISIG